ncbi:LacI family DNA-binding transcriptional regulator [Cerasicoccus frondis]|uniref:LacI family DNA-binding transcriptional regulator n=1 Tax=Cerasicoccus frondis TaxID=490090 RepID=UPI002852AC74|nr:LacI family DNA-binding transcriptional regulator [Cerasicoccus frondis]
MPRRITQSDIAKKAGLSRPTVSLALKGSSAVSEQTRRYVREVAESLGYSPDPMLSALSKYRLQEESEHYRGTLAWVSYSSEDMLWNKITPYAAYYEGARMRAERVGFNIEIFDAFQQELSAKRLSGILDARGIRGMLVCPPVWQDQQFNLPFDDYAFVTFGYTIREPAMHRVTSSHYRATWSIFDRFASQGYRRIGFAGSHEVNIKTQEHCLSVYLCGCRKYNLEILPELVDDDMTTDQFEDWVEKHRFDAVIFTSPLWPLIRGSKFRIPEDLAVASPMTPVHYPELTGVIEKSEQIGSAAVDTLIHLIQQDDRGIPTDPQNILIEGRWNEGTTVPPLDQSV